MLAIQPVSLVYTGMYSALQILLEKKDKITINNFHKQL